MELGNSETNKLYHKHDMEYKYILNDNYIDLSNKNSAPSIIADLVADNSIVLDVGCSHGLLGKWLKINKNCIVYGIDNDANVLNFAKQKSQYDDVFLIDLDNSTGVDFKRFNELQEIFDYIILADVLEHLKNPVDALLMLAKKLRPYSNFLISILNIANIDIILNLIEGRFNYNEFGILDNTHLRFFTKKSFIDLINSINESNALNEFKFQLDFITSTTYLSDFVKKIVAEKPVLYNLLKSSNPGIDVLQNIFSLIKVKKEDRVFNSSHKENIKPIDKIYATLEELIKISEDYEQDKDNIVKMFKIIDEQNAYVLQQVAEQSSKFVDNNLCRLDIFPIEDNINDIDTLFFPKFDNPSVSIIISVHNKWAYTYNCLKSILHNTKDISYEVIVGDNLSADETPQLFKEKIKNVNYYRNNQDLGYLRNCNYASTFAHGKYICLLNNDIQVTSGWLNEMVRCFRIWKDVGLVGSKLIFPDGRLQEAGGIVWRDASAWNYGRFSNPNDSEYNYAHEADYCTGACIVIESELFNKFGGYDNIYIPAYYEDTDLAFKVRSAGRKVIYNPYSMIVHYEGVTHGVNINEGIKTYQLRNQKIFYERWKSVLETRHYEHGTNLARARDHACGKYEILIVDWGVPQPDRDAGSRAIMFTIECLIDMGAVVKFWPDNLLKDEQYIRRLQDIGVEVFYGPKWIGKFANYIKENDLDVILLSRPNIAVKYIDDVKKFSNSMSVFYGHDIHHERFMMQYGLTKEPQALEMANVFRKVEEELWSRCDLSLYPSMKEANAVKMKNDKANVKPVQLYYYDNFPQVDVNSLKKRRDILFVAGFGHSPNEDAALWFVKDIFPLIKSVLADIRLFLVGSNPTEKIKSLESSDIIITGYVTDEKLDGYYSNARIAVVPLRFGAGVKSKVTEALRHGVPLVTTSIGAQGLNGLNTAAFVVDTPEQFADAAIKLLKDDDLWEKYAKEGQMYAQTHFSKQSMIESLKPLFEKYRKI
ncbi:MAG: glycosyltransferase [bacterium]